MCHPTGLGVLFITGKYRIWLQKCVRVSKVCPCSKFDNGGNGSFLNAWVHGKNVKNGKEWKEPPE
jgi:hypothetical protein